MYYKNKIEELYIVGLDGQFCVKETVKDAIKEKYRVNLINNAINYPCDIDEIYCDATQINEKSRNKLLNRLNLKDVNIIIVYIKTSLNVILDRNNKREGISRVPDDAIIDIFNNRLSEPTFNEKYKYTEVRVVNGDILNF